MGKEDVRDLMARVRRGDPAAVEQLVERYSEPIRRHIRYLLIAKTENRTVLPPHDFDSRVESLFDETLHRFLKRVLPKPDGDEEAKPLDGEEAFNLLAYLKTVASSIHIDKFRVTERVESLDPDLDLAASSLDPLEQAATRDELEATLGSLSPENRRILKLRLEGSTFPEIGEILEMSAAATRMRYQRVVFELRKRREWENDRG